MNIRGLLLGSAAALAAATGANAADAVMAPEPEPVEYVRVCDAYGAGFFYIPGTETCLQISGYIWYQFGAEGWENAGDTYAYQGQSHPFGFDDGWYKNIEARVNFDARSETEWGTLRSYIRFQASWNGVGDGAVAADQAYIELGGFRAGYTESAWVDSQVGGVSSWGSHSWSGMSYGWQQRAVMAYSFQSNGFFGVLSLEDDALAGEGYLPDVVAIVGYSAGWGGVWGKAAYDEGDDSFAASLGAQFNIPNMNGSSLRVIGWYSETATNKYGILYDAGLPLFNVQAAEWSIMASYNHVFTDTFSASVAGQYFAGFTGFPDAYLAELSLVWLPVTNFEVRSEIAYAKTDGFDGTASGWLRFTRYF
nr:porin [Mesorhizobium sp.]